MQRDILDQIDSTKRAVDGGLTYRKDKVNDRGIQEHWQSHARQIATNARYQAYDDCDGFALSYAQMAIFNGINPECIRICYVEISGYGGHLCTAIYNPEDATTYVLDNNEKTPVKWHELRGYEWISYMSMSEPGQWIKFPAD